MATSHNFGYERVPSLPTTVELAVVFTVMLMNVEEVTDGWLKEHVEAAGSPLQLKVTAPAAELLILTWKENTAGCPALTVALVVRGRIWNIGVICAARFEVLFPGAPSPPPETVV